MDMTKFEIALTYAGINKPIIHTRMATDFETLIKNFKIPKILNKLKSITYKEIE